MTSKYSRELEEHKASLVRLLAPGMASHTQAAYIRWYNTLIDMFISLEERIEELEKKDDTL